MRSNSHRNKKISISINNVRKRWFQVGICTLIFDLIVFDFIPSELYVFIKSVAI